MKYTCKAAVALAAVIAASLLCGCGKDEPTTVVEIVPSSLTVIGSDSPSEEKASPQPFGESDFVIGGRLLLGMTPEYAVSELGEPEITLSDDGQGSEYGSRITMTYEGLTLEYYNVLNGVRERKPTDDLTLSGVICRTRKVAFARGLHVGSTSQEVLASFAMDEDGKELFLDGSSEPNGTMLYGSGMGGTQHEDSYSYAYIDRSGLLSGREKYYSIRYCLETPLIWYGSEENVLCRTVSLSFCVDSGSETVTEIRLIVDAAPWTHETNLPE